MEPPHRHRPVPPRDNPFATSRVERLEWRDGGSGSGGGDGGPATLPRLLERLDELGGRGAVVGPEGHGKTTLLDALERHLAARGLDPRRLAVHRDRPLPRRELRRFLSGVGPRDFLLIDGAGHLRPWTWWRIRLTARRAAGLVVALHEPGLLPTLHRCTTSPELLRDLVAELLPDAAAPVPLPSAAELHRRHGGDLRLALRELYDRCAGR